MSSNASLNHIFRTVWNQALGAMVAVAEISAGPGKSSGTATRARRGTRSPRLRAGNLNGLALSVALAWCGLPAMVLANPTGAVVVAGQASMDTQGNRLLVTTQNGAGTNHSAINWQTFSIPAGQSTYFQQPNVSSTSINRVVSSTPSLIFGTLGSNGKLVLVNQSGITVGAGAVVDTAAFTASALAMSDASALSGNMRFGDGSATGAGVSVQGHILARTGDVVLLGLDVSTTRDALIQAPNGSTVLAAGQRIALTGPGLEGIVLEVQAPGNSALNLGTLQGDAVGVFAGTLKHSGDIQANAVSVEGGRVLLKALGQASVDGRITAQRADGSGGSVQLRAQDIAMDAGARIVVDAAQQGDGGRVLVLADNSTRFDGSISAQGGALGGNGGFVETSGAQLKVGDTARVSSGAAMGQVGSWLLDPTDFTIAASGGDVSGSTLATSLAAGNVTVQSSGGASGTAGDVIVNDTVAWSTNKLTLSAFNNIRINNTMTASGAANLALEYGQGAPVASNTSQIITGASGKVNLPAGTTNFTTLQGSGGVVKAYTVITSLGISNLVNVPDTLQGMQGGVGLNYALGTDIDASASALSMIQWGYGIGFTPIPGFSGTLDGLGHTISGLHISSVSATGVGLIGSLASGGVVRNLGLVNASVSAKTNVGALVGSNAGLVTNSYASGGTVTGTPDANGTVGEAIGGLVGLNSGGTVSSSYASGSVAAATASSSIGGLVGWNAGGTVTDSYAAGTVNGSMASYVGGLVGYNNQGSGQGTITKSYATANVLAYGIAGGLVGFNDLATVDNSYTTSAANVSGTSDNLGGLVGENTGTILNSHASGSVSGGFNSNKLGGLVGTNSGLINSTTTGTLSTTYATGVVNSGNSTGSNYGGLVGYTFGGTINNAYASGSVNASFDSNVGGLVGGNYRSEVGLGGTITASFATGTVNAGNGNGIGGLVGANNSTISSSYASGQVLGNGSVGGLVGSNVSGGIVSNTYAVGSVSGGSYVGGLMGQNAGSVATSYSTGQVLGSTLVGGLLGYNAGSVGNSDFLQETGGNSSLSGIGYDSALAAPTNNGATPLSIVASKAAGSYSGWDLSSIGGSTSVWRIYDGNSTPLLRSLLTSLTLANTSLAYNGVTQSGVTTTGVSGAAASGIHASSTPYNGYWSTQAQGYDISGGSLTITPLTLTPTITNTGVTKVYDGTRLTTMSPTFSFVGLISGDTTASLSSTTDVYDSAHVASASKVTLFGLSIASITGSHGSLPGDYVLDANSKDVAATITAKPLNATAVIASVAKTYDGSLVATGSTVSGSTTGVVGTDSFSLNTSGLSLNFSNAHVAATGKTISATGNVALGTLSSSGSGALDGSSLDSLVVSLPTDYVLAGQPAIASVAGTINAKLLSSSASILSVAKMYDGLLQASTSSISGLTTGAINGDTVALNTSGMFLDNNSAHAGATTVTATGSATIDAPTGGGVGNKDGTPNNAVAGLAGDYALTQPTITNQGVAGLITARALTSSATITSVAKTYDGMLAASTSSIAGSISGMVNGDTVALNTSGMFLDNNTAHAGLTSITATGTSAMASFVGGGVNQKNGNAGNAVAGLASDYTLTQPTITNQGVAGTILAKQLVATASIGGATSKTYDGTLVATGATVSGGTTGAIGTDSVALDTSGLTLAYSNSHVATTGKTIGATGTVAKGAVSSTGSGARDGSNSSNLVVSLPGDYEISVQPTISSVAGTITARSLVANATIGGTLSKVYDGTTAATGASVTGTVSNTLAGDTVTAAFNGGVLEYNSKDVSAANSISVTVSGTVGLTISSSSVGSLLSDYSLGFTLVNPVNASITPRPVSNWLSQTSGQWSTASNWDVMPSTGNVLAVNIPAGGSVVFDALAPSTSLQSLNSQGTVSMAGGSLSVSNAFSTANYSQSGGTLTGAGSFTAANSFSQSAGSIAMGGAVSIRQASGNLAVNGGISGSSIALEAVNGAISQTAPLVTAGLLKVRASNGVSLTDAGNAVSSFVAITTGTGNVLLTNVGALNVAGVTVANGNLDIDNTGALLTSGAIAVHGGGVDITTHSPLVINNTVNADGSITLAALTQDSTSNIVVNGAMASSSGGISVQAYNNFIQNAGLNAALAIDVAAGGVVAFGPNATSIGNPVSYEVKGAPYVPPWIASTLSGGATDFVVAFMDKFQDALVAQDIASDDPLGIKQRKKEGIAFEGEICKP